MIAVKNNYVCRECSARYRKWLGRCTDCHAWNSLEEVLNKEEYSFTKIKHPERGNEDIIDLQHINHDNKLNRYQTGIKEFDRVIGGGIVSGAAILLYGEPGIGKSTLILQICDAASKNKLSCLYVSGEESANQIKMRSMRLGINNANIKVLITTNISSIINAAQNLEKPALLIVDSIQTMYIENINSAPGTVSQVKICTYELTKIAKTKNISLLIIGHITKEGNIAGPKLLEHMVDTVLSFEGEGRQEYRIVRSSKNRYGSTNEIGVFSMSSHGLIEIQNPSSAFLTNNQIEVAGSSIFATHEGSRSILLEVQALVVPSYLASPRRAAVGWDNSRLAMVIAILCARLGLKLMDKEIYLNIAGGLKITEPGMDLAGAVALISATWNICIPNNIVFFGEIGLLGELRQVSHTENRINEAKKLGFKKIVIPSGNGNSTKENLQKNKDADCKIIKIQDIRELLCFLKQSSGINNKISSNTVDYYGK